MTGKCGTRRRKRNAAKPITALLAAVAGIAAHADAPLAPLPADITLAARANAAIVAGQGTCGQEYANILSDGWLRDDIDRLAGKKSATSGELQAARSSVAPIVDTLEQAPTWPKPIPLVAHRAAGVLISPSADDAPVWRSATPMTGLYQLNSTVRRDDPATAYRTAWDERYLYVRFDCVDANIISPPSLSSTDPFKYDCVELYILPERDLAQYWEIDVSPSGCTYAHLHNKRLTGWGCTADDPLTSMPSLRTTAQIWPSTAPKPGYTIEIAVPFSALPTYTRGNPPQVGDTLQVMLLRIDKQPGSFTQYAFTPLIAWGHNIWNYSKLTLAK